MLQNLGISISLSIAIERPYHKWVGTVSKGCLIGVSISILITASTQALRTFAAYEAICVLLSRICSIAFWYRRVVCKVHGDPSIEHGMAEDDNANHPHRTISLVQRKESNPTWIQDDGRCLSDQFCPDAFFLHGIYVHQHSQCSHRAVHLANICSDP